jgi:purine-binding chemotaxis protein CheW
MKAPNSETSLEPSGVQALAGKYLTFGLGDESYGLPVLKVREIIKLTPITAVPQMPDYVKGVINLRGKVIPVVDLRAKFGLAKAATTERTCIVVVQVEMADHSKTFMGLIVDGVEEVAHIATQDIEETPDFGATLNTDYILGMAKVKGAVKALLDIDRVVTADGLELLQPNTAH